MDLTAWLHLFIPHKKNNHRASLLHAQYLILILIVLLGLQNLLSIVRKTSPAILGFATDMRLDRLFAETNRKREESGLTPLKFSPLLSQAAKAKADDMFTKDYWAHTNPEGKSPWDFIVNSGYHYIYAGENLAKDFQNSDEVIDAWLASPTHKANILRPQYRDIGFAIVSGKLQGEETTLVVQMFGTQVSSIAQEEAPVAAQKEQPIILQAVHKRPRLDIAATSRALMLFFALLMFLVFISDGVFLWRRKIFRVSGHNLAHLIFLGSLIGTIWFTSLGAIL